MATSVRFLTFCFFWMMLCALYVPLETKDHDCGSSLVYINVTSSGGVLYSPGYPEEYPNSVSCTWLLTSKQRGKVLQLRPLDLQLGPQAKHDGACSGDIVTAYDGRTTSSSLLHVWCGEDVQVVYSSGASVLVTFVADRHRRHRGFAIHYSLLTLSDNSCERDTVKTLPLQNNNPIVVDFSSLPTLSQLTSTCSWRLVADDMGSHVVVDLDRFDNGLPCEHGNFSVYDGPETTSPEVVRWCARSTKPFTSVYMSGGQGMVVLRTRPNVTTVLRFRFYTRPKVFPRCSLSSPSHMPTVELKGEDPVYINFPLAVSDRGASCPVHVLSATASTLWARVDVLHTPQGLPACPTSPASSSVTVLQANETEGDNSAPTVVHSTCFRENRPVFWPIAQSVVISPAADSRGLLLKITPADRGSCHGRLLHVTAPTDEVFVIKNPRASLRTLEYSRSMWCRYVVSGKNEGDHVLVNMDAELCELKESCGDYIRLYDGKSTDSPLLYDSANRTHVTLHVISTGRHVTFEFATDDRDNRGFIKAEFNSVPGPNLCSEIQEVKASRLPQNLSSFNFPHYYPVNYMCQYCIVSDNPDDVIHIHVIESDMMYSCSDVVEVYEGDSDHKAPEFLGRFCSHDKPHYVSKGPGLCLLFRSDPSGHGKGWLLSYHAAPPASSVGHPQHDSGSISSGSSPATTATAVVALVVLIAVIVVFIVYIVKNKRRESRSLE